MIKAHPSEQDFIQGNSNRSLLHKNQFQLKELQTSAINTSNWTNSRQNTKTSTKVRSSTGKNGGSILGKESVSNISEMIRNLQESSWVGMPEVKTQRQVLLQKRKSYAQGIRQKNRTQLVESQQKSRAKNNRQSINQSFNTSLNLTPKKVNKSQHRFTQFNLNDSEIERQYYGLSEEAESKVFKETNMNRMNQSMLGGMNSCRVDKKRSDQSKLNQSRLNQSRASHKVTNAINNSLPQFKGEYCNGYNQQNIKEQSGVFYAQDSAFSKEDENSLCDRERYSGKNEAQNRKDIRNKENRVELPNPKGNKKNGSKCNSYAELFDKKTTLSQQKNKPSTTNPPRQITPVLKQTHSLNSMVDKELQFASQLQLSCQFTQGQLNQFNKKDSMECRINDFMGEDLSSKTQDLSIIDYSSSQIKLKSERYSCQPYKLSFNFNILSQTIDYSSQYETIKKQEEKIRKQEEKEILILAKQNSTFKRQLATFRKQNSSLRKQLQHNKKYIKQLEQKAKTLIEEQKVNTLNVIGVEGQNRFLNMDYNRKALQQTELKCEQIQLEQSQWNEYIKKDCASLRLGQNNLQKILQFNEKSIYSLRGSNKALELKVYLLQRRAAHEQEMSKKRLALQINSWRQKYNKLRNQHLRIKNSSFLNSDSSISMDISSEE